MKKDSNEKDRPEKKNHKFQFQKDIETIALMLLLLGGE
tara:strand:- start:3316 stop:3429 length:114 start_codon:yes stop_codon:yes gene_type:complete